MKLIIGLGNPGPDYEFTRHNFGHLVVNNFAQQNSLKWSKHKDLQSEITDLKIGQEKIILAKSLTFMNESGLAVAHLKKFFKLKNEDIIVVYDDLAFDFGILKIAYDRSSGGHNGLASIIQYLKNQNFIRLRLGIGPQLGVAEKFVLLKFSATQKKQLPKILDLSIQALNDIITDGLAKATSKYNTK